MALTAPIYTKLAIAQIVANIPVPNFVQIGLKMQKIRAKLCFLSEIRYGIYNPHFHETHTCSNCYECSCTEFLSNRKKDT